MSHYTTVELEIKDQASFVDALCENWPRPLAKENVELHDEAQNLYGYTGDKRSQKANIIVRRKHVGGAANDIGFLVNDGKATAYISEYDRGNGYSTKWQGRVMQSYARNVAIKEAKKKGYRVKETRTEDNKIKLVLTR